MPWLRSLKLDLETVVTLAATIGSGILLILVAVYAGPLWRDEVNTANVAQMPFREMWQNLTFESFPPFYVLLLHGCGLVGLAGSDVQLRLLGAGVGLFVLGSLWVSARSLHCRAPILSIGLMGFLPVFIFIMGANRAYGMATGFLVLSFATLWRLVEQPSWTRMMVAGGTCFLFVQCVYYDALFLAAMLSGGALVAWQRRQWKLLAALTGIGALSAGSLAMYWPILHRGARYAAVTRWPFFSSKILWQKLSASVTARSGAQSGQGHEIWLWIVLFLAGLLVAARMRRAGASPPADPSLKPAAADPGGCRPWQRTELAQFCAASMLFGTLGYLALLSWMSFPTQKWYYIEMLCLGAISFDGLLGANRPALRPWGAVRVALLVGLLAWYGKAAWAEAHTRRTDLDLVARLLEKEATAGDLIVVDGAFEGITFNRYYHGVAPWVTLPPIESHLVHRNDLVFEKMQQPDAMGPVLLAATNALRGGHAVWLVGGIAATVVIRPQFNHSDAWLAPFANYWNAQISSELLRHATERRPIETTRSQPVFAQEDLSIERFAGYKDGSEAPTVAHPINH